MHNYYHDHNFTLFLDHNGHQGLRKTHPEQLTRKPHRPNFGAFGSAKAQSLLNRATESVRYIIILLYLGANMLVKLKNLIVVTVVSQICLVCKQRSHFLPGMMMSKMREWEQVCPHCQPQLKPPPALNPPPPLPPHHKRMLEIQS